MRISDWSSRVLFRSFHGLHAFRVWADLIRRKYEAQGPDPAVVAQHRLELVEIRRRRRRALVDHAAGTAQQLRALGGRPRARVGALGQAGEKLLDRKSTRLNSRH